MPPKRSLRYTTTVMIEKYVPEPVRNVMRLVRSVVNVVLFILAVYAVWVFAPIYSKKIEFQAAMQEIARTSAYNDHDESQVRDEVMQKARELRVPVNDEAVQVVREQDFVRISATYELPVHLTPSRVLTLNFAPSSVEKTLTHAAIQVKSVKDGK